MKKSSVTELLLLAGLLLFALLPRLFLIHTKGFELFNSDQALIGLMAKHILEGRPMVYAYGQGYMGSLESFVVAFIYLLAGISRFSTQLAPLSFYLGFIAVNFFLLKRAFGLRVSMIANLFLVLSPPLLTQLSVTALGGYPEILFFGSLTLLGSLHALESKKTGPILFWTGMVAGIGFWVHNLVLMYILAMGIFWFLTSDFWKRTYPSLSWRKVILLEGLRVPFYLRWAGVLVHVGIFLFIVLNLASFFAGSTELSFWGLRVEVESHPFLVKELKKILLILGAETLILSLWVLGPKAVWRKVQPALPVLGGFFLGGSPAFLHSLLGGEGYRVIHASGLVYAKDLIPHVQSVFWSQFIGSVLGIPVALPSSWKGVATIQAWVMLLMISGLLAAFGFRHRKPIASLLQGKPLAYPNEIFPFVLATVTLTICLLNDLTADRYLTPLFFSTSLIFALTLSQLKTKIGVLAWPLALFLLGNQVYTNYHWYKQLPNFDPMERGRESVIRFLEDHSIQGAYANYWHSYAMTLETREKIVVAPFRSEDRYPSYTKFVDGLPKVAYVFTEREDDSYTPFQKALDEARISYEKAWIEPFRLYVIDRGRKTEKGVV